MGLDDLVHPSLGEFKKLAKKGNLIPLYVDVFADQLTPVSLIASHWNKTPHCFLLESVEGGENLGRYSIVSFGPEAIISGNKGRSQIENVSSRKVTRFRDPVLETLRTFMGQYKPVQVPGLPRFFGGAVGYFSYDGVRDFERIPRSNPDPLGWPQSVFYVAGDMFIFDNTQQILKIITCVHVKKGAHVTRVYKRGVGRLIKNLGLLKNLKPQQWAPKAKLQPSDKDSFVSNVDRGPFMEGVKLAKEYIASGDVIQVVLSRRIETKTKANPLDIYRSLRVVNPSPYMYLFKMKDRSIIGSSPESLVRLEEGVATTRPIAGTRPRGKTSAEDERLEKELLKDPKEKAEHIMLVDLGRNDLGRVCRYGSVKVPQFMAIERYSHVMHIVSEVTGKIKPGKDSFDLFRAVFPAGTVAGAPKIRAMEIIDELEPDMRGPYAGAIGYFSFSGNMDVAITIRTILWDKGQASVQAGAGIVADSNPAREFEETENKAAGMKQTIRMAEKNRSSLGFL